MADFDITCVPSHRVIMNWIENGTFFVVSRSSGCRASITCVCCTTYSHLETVRDALRAHYWKQRWQASRYKMFITICTGFLFWQNHKICVCVNSLKQLQSTGLLHSQCFESTTNMWNIIVLLITTVGVDARLHKLPMNVLTPFMWP